MLYVCVRISFFWGGGIEPVILRGLVKMSHANGNIHTYILRKETFASPLHNHSILFEKYNAFNDQSFACLCLVFLLQTFITAEQKCRYIGFLCIMFCVDILMLTYTVCYVRNMLFLLLVNSNFIIEKGSIEE
jgi:hypothetical protein